VLTENQLTFYVLLGRLSGLKEQVKNVTSNGQQKPENNGCTDPEANTTFTKRDHGKVT